MEILNYDITFWNRLESRTRKKEFDRTFRAEIRDPLWMISRQWQMGEFEAEDKGSPVFACIEWDNARLDKVSLQKQFPSDISHEMPLEAEVERIGLSRIKRADDGEIEVIPNFDIALQIEMGRHWLRILGKELPDGIRDSVITQFKNQAELQFEDPPNEPYENAHLLNNRELLQKYALARLKKLINGGKLYKRLKEGETASSLIGVNNADLDNAGNKYIEWFDKRYSQPINESLDGWDPQHLEYGFATSAPQSETDVEVLSAREYYQGRLDWYSFDIEKQTGDLYNSDLLNNPNLPAEKKTNRRYIMPTEIEFPGMPKVRWWEFEDHSINFQAINANLNEMSKLTFVEFGLLYSNDWFFMPFRSPVGNLLDFKQITITDSFGQTTSIKHFDDSNRTPHWALFRLFNQNFTGIENQVDRRLLLPPVVMEIMESKPLEQVHFFRDETSNMVWGIESIIHDGLGAGKDGYEHALQMKEYFESLATESTEETIPTDANIRYKIANSVPENWIPFIPVHANATEIREIKLQRAAMPRILNGLPIRRVRPLTRLLRHGLDGDEREHYFIFEEEVPRSGARVNLTWQRVRWHDGRIVLWLGYRKTNGRGEGSSGLRFDQINPKTESS